MIITVDTLKQIAPGSKKTRYRLLGDLSTWMNTEFPLYDIDTHQEVRHILAQLAHESDSFNTLEEYASGKAYEGRVDLGNVLAGDGKKFKGRGPIQVTGRKNYSLMGAEMGFPDLFIESPHLLATPEYGVRSACIFWNSRNLSEFANMPDTTKIWVKRLNRHLEPIEYITWRVNGGFTHIDLRKQFYERAKAIIK